MRCNKNEINQNIEVKSIQQQKMYNLTVKL